MSVDAACPPPSARPKLVIWGCGGHGREVHLLCEQLGLDVVGFLDERPAMKGTVVDGVPVLGTLSDIEALRSEACVLCAGVGDPALKQRFAEMTSAAGFHFPEPLIHPNVQVPARTQIGAGSVLCAGVIVTVNVRIGRHVIVNMASTVAHDVVLGDFVTLSPGVNVSGSVTIDDGVYVGTNAAIREKVRIHQGAVIGGGAFVRGDVPPRVLYAGVPAVLKKRLS